MPTARWLANVAKVPAKKRAGRLKVILVKAKSDVKQPSDAEVATVKPVKLTRKITSNLSITPIQIRVDARASVSKAPVVSVKKSAAPIKGQWIQPAPLLEAALLVESQESSPHNLTPKAPEKTTNVAVKLLVTSTVTPCF
jgi:hypothetical protein